VFEKYNKINVLIGNNKIKKPMQFNNRYISLKKPFYNIIMVFFWLLQNPTLKNYNYISAFYILYNCDYNF